MSKTALRSDFKEKSLPAYRIEVCTPEDMELLIEIQPFNQSFYQSSDKRHKNFPPLLEPLGRKKELYFLCVDPSNKIMAGATLHSPAEIPPRLAGHTMKGQTEPTDLIWGQISVGAAHQNKGLSKKIMEEMLSYLESDKEVTRVILTPLEEDGKAYLGQKGHLHRFAEQCPCPVLIYDEDLNILPILEVVSTKPYNNPYTTQQSGIAPLPETSLA